MKLMRGGRSAPARSKFDGLRKDKSGFRSYRCARRSMATRVSG
jgi:hypothetical protein